MSLFSRKPKETASITYVSHTGASQTFDVPLGTSVMEGGVRNGVEEIVAECGGACICATSHVFVDEAWVARLPPPGADELAMLEMTATPARGSVRTDVAARRRCAPVLRAFTGLVLSAISRFASSSTSVASSFAPSSCGISPVARISCDNAEPSAVSAMRARA